MVESVGARTLSAGAKVDDVNIAVVDLRISDAEPRGDRPNELSIHKPSCEVAHAAPDTAGTEVFCTGDGITVRKKGIE